ncbi:hypothetical protein NBO_4g0044 [Nosema bombycis CQ1]|uniref:Uncharacterized protein n=1 Tax=Nosema bombycis (strain CQ1 / CVCC 102059) TaxID=578461 RepID=R0KX19_NOSB1|nr:hypothetical protein NBO_4g0044 [Nosema bombycis CQ1]|eukprot:EOB15416.1 hypothetical protein NBO_4g0044 [Nosema bombycis CQ1]
MAVNIAFNGSIETFRSCYVKDFIPIEFRYSIYKPEIKVDQKKLLKNQAEVQVKYSKDIVKSHIELKSKFKPENKVLILIKTYRISFYWMVLSYVALKSIGADAYLVSSTTSKLRCNKSHIKLDTVNLGDMS